MTDYYSLDDTLAGRVTQSGVVGAFVASPDYVSSRPARALVKLGLLAGGGALVAVLNSFDEDPDNDPAVMVDQLRQSIGHIGHRAGPDSDTPAGDFSVDSPTRTWAIIVAAAVVILMTVRVDAAVQRRIAAFLRKRGVRRPNTLLGAVAGAVSFAAAEVSHRQRLAAAREETA
ncbi:hypothetical protein [Corynebacterium suedekumii]|uniref:Uncharacterized protein n=1 Tax=Corynebacterium suedekumii TaxID=3049801 RepID=A0ABY8VSF2_9CORY|nr:hypothetical protein [Corynebacterium suedekumii]WIM71103.1 hypothetical protein QP029_04675 [Corynebacterium suedekumii]